MLGKIEVQQTDEAGEEWALAIHDGVQWVQLGPSGDVCDMHESADRLRGVLSELCRR